MPSRRRQHIETERQPDGVPRSGLFSEPVRVAHLRALDPELLEDGTHRVTFLLEVRDAEDRRCPDFAVEARVDCPGRSATAQGTTDMLGRIRFRATGSSGEYRITVTDVGAGGVPWDREAGPLQARHRVA